MVANLGDLLHLPPSVLINHALFFVGMGTGASAPSESGAGVVGAFTWGSPSEFGAGRMPGMLFLVRRGCMRGVWRMLAGLVGSTDVGLDRGDVEGKRSV